MFPPRNLWAPSSSAKWPKMSRISSYLWGAASPGRAWGRPSLRRGIRGWPAAPPPAPSSPVLLSRSFIGGKLRQCHGESGPAHQPPRGRGWETRKARLATHRARAAATRVPRRRSGPWWRQAAAAPAPTLGAGWPFLREPAARMPSAAAQGRAPGRAEAPKARRAAAQGRLPAS